MPCELWLRGRTCHQGGSGAQLRSGRKSAPTRCRRDTRYRGKPQAPSLHRDGGLAQLFRAPGHRL
eukprot:966562-Pyramimonas_sp.AAC.1